MQAMAYKLKRDTIQLFENIVFIPIWIQEPDQKAEKTSLWF